LFTVFQEKDFCSLKISEQRTANNEIVLSGFLYHPKFSNSFQVNLTMDKPELKRFSA